MRPVAQADGDDAPWLVGELVPGLAAVGDDVFVGVEDAIGERWTRLVRQFGGLAKVDRVGFYAANFSIISAVA